jgi:hypothetical protein
MDYYEKYMKYKNKYLHAKHTLGYDMSGGTLTPGLSSYTTAHPPKKIYIFFQDVADADNFMSVVAFRQLYGAPTSDNPIHFVLTQRPENLGIPKAYNGGPINAKLLREDKHGLDNPEDALLVAEDGARRFIMFMHKHYKIGETLKEAYDLIRVYDGGLPSMSSNLSHLSHKRDYLFDRADLLPRNGPLGEIITADEYLVLEKQYNDIPENTASYDYDYKNDNSIDARRANIREAINVALGPFKNDINRRGPLLRPLTELTSWIEEKQNSLGIIGKRPVVQVVAFILAPLTGFANMFQIEKGKVLKKYLTNVYGQLFAWDNASPHYFRTTSSVNILKNQFNVDCDTDAVTYILQELDTCKKLENITWIPSEMLKSPEHMTSITLIRTEIKLKGNKSPLEKLWEQWCDIKGPPQTIFDPSVIFYAHEKEYEKSKPMIKRIDKIKYIPHYGQLFTAEPSYKIFKQSPMQWNRTVYQITKEEEKDTKHTAVYELDNNIHIEKLTALFNFKPTVAASK